MTGWTSPDEVAGEDGDLEVISNSATRCLPWKTTEQAFVCPTIQRDPTCELAACTDGSLAA